MAIECQLPTKCVLCFQLSPSTTFFYFKEIHNKSPVASASVCQGSVACAFVFTSGKRSPSSVLSTLNVSASKTCKSWIMAPSSPTSADANTESYTRLRVCRKKLRALFTCFLSNGGVVKIVWKRIHQNKKKIVLGRKVRGMFFFCAMFFILFS